MTIVTNKEELSAANKRGDNEIIVKGELADNLKRAKKITMLSAGSIALIGAAIAAATVTAPVTGGLSYAAAVPVAAMSGTEIALIILAASLGLTLLIAICKDYEEISYSKGHLVLKKRQN